MIYLRTGANGSGKTLLTLRDVREKSLAEHRPVYYNGRFEMLADFGWTKIDIKDWQSVPDGAIFIVDECHNDFPVRAARDLMPDYVRMMAEHRRRGFDFYLITQHPMNIDPFIRRLIGSPGWHQHLKRVSGAPLVSVLEWPAVNDQPQKNGSGASAAVKMVSFPKEVYAWYASTSLDTAKVKIPFQVKLLAASFILIPLLGFYGWKTFQARQPFKDPNASAAAQLAGGGLAPGTRTDKLPAVSRSEFLASYVPRVEGLPQTAPRYDDVTKPTNAPYPAACVQMGPVCKCYTQQGTKLSTEDLLCRQIVSGGFFLDWGMQAPQGAQAVRNDSVKASMAPVVGTPALTASLADTAVKPAALTAGDADALQYLRAGRRLVRSN